MVDRRLTWLAAVVLIWGTAIFLKLISLQVIHHREFLNKAAARQEISIEIPAPRGTLFSRSGRRLAMSVSSDSVYVNPMKLPDIGVASELLALALGMDRGELESRLRDAYNAHRGFLWVKRKISEEEAESLRKLPIDWIFIQHESQRHYPNGSLAAHVLGSVNSEEKGNAGIEMYLDSELRGVPGKERVLTDARRHNISSRISIPPKPGTSLTLTIDEQVQFVAERELAQAVESHNAISGSVVVMDPNTGDILAMASYPSYDPNEPVKAGAFPPERINHAIQLPFEPGSVFKVMNYSAAFDTTKLTPDTPVNCGGGVIRVGGKTIHDSHGGTGVVPAKTAFAKSSNVGAVRVGQTVGEENMYEYVRRFGFGQKTGIPLPAENKGKLRPTSRWSKVSLASISIGQEVSVTTLQLARAVSVIANGGSLVMPRLILKEGDRAVPVSAPVRIIKPETAFTMRAMMENVVLNGTGSRARLDGYTGGGKTGSAQIFDVKAGHYSHTYNGSYVGFAPATNPRIVVAVTVNGTRGEGGFGGVTSAPVFKAVATEALREFDVPKDIPETIPPTLVAKTESADDLAISDLENSSNSILSDDDASDDAAAVAAEAARTPGPKVPNFKGKTMRAVLAEAAAKGLTVLPDGSGIARLQSPPPGAPLRQGERIRVQFAR
ncbi:MAG: transpeptidase family protein [Acidobacteria bacterium]|nr:transpeptidase family protein [Acidobacteriota bacterium]